MAGFQSYVDTYTVKAVYSNLDGEALGKTFDMKILAKTTPKGQIRIGRLAFVDVEDRQVEKK